MTDIDPSDHTIMDRVPEEPELSARSKMNKETGGNGSYAYDEATKVLQMTREQKFAMLTKKEDELLALRLAGKPITEDQVKYMAELRMMVDMTSPNPKDRAKAREQFLELYGLREQKVRLTSVDDYTSELGNLFRGDFDSDN